jgi:hypothetical protein
VFRWGAAEAGSSSYENAGSELRNNTGCTSGRRRCAAFRAAAFGMRLRNFALGAPVWKAPFDPYPGLPTPPETTAMEYNTIYTQNEHATRGPRDCHRSFSSASNAATEAPRSRNNRRTRGLQVRRLPEHATTLHDAPASALK